MDGPDLLKPHTKRIKELNQKATQVLVFLSFAMVAAVTLRPDRTNGQDVAVAWAMRWWTGAIFFVILCILPVKEIRADDPRWYQSLRRFKAVVLWLALICLAIGAGWFYKAI